MDMSTSNYPPKVECEKRKRLGHTKRNYKLEVRRKVGIYKQSLIANTSNGVNENYFLDAKVITRCANSSAYCHCYGK